MEREPLLAWQLRLYPENHKDRRNLLVHVCTVPVFHVGLGALVFGALGRHPWAALSGVLAMAMAVALQGRTHKLEATPPQPFRGPLDVVARIFVEQLVTFPRFALNGGLAKAWREEAPREGTA